MLCMQGLGVFFLCAVVAPQASCRTSAPGVGKSIPLSILSLLVTQALCWTAIGLLPRAKRTGKLSLTGERNNRSKAAGTGAAAAKAAGKARGVAARGVAARGVAARAAAAAGQELRGNWRARQQPKGPAATGAHTYAPLDEEAPPDQHELLGTISVPPDLVRARHGAWGDGGVGSEDGGDANDDDDDDGNGNGNGNDTRHAGVSSGCCSAHSYKGNRMLRLLVWDLGSFASCALLFGLMLLLVAAGAAAPPPHLPLLATNGNGTKVGTKVEGLTLSALLAGLSALADGGSEAWHVEEWQLACAFFIARILFALSALPFLVFEVPLLRTLLSHTSPTGYSRHGGVVAKDDEGLQAYTDWLQRELRARRTAAHLSPAALQALTLAAEQAQAYLGVLPDEHLHRRATERVKTDLEAQLLRHVPRGHVLYPRLFPEQLLCDEYLEHSVLDSRGNPRKAAPK
jgi:hypothetical protein